MTMMLNMYQSIIVRLAVMTMHFVVVGCLVENTFAFAELDTLVLEKKEDAQVSLTKNANFLGERLL